MRHTPVNKVKGYSPKGEIKNKTRMATQNAKDSTVKEEEIVKNSRE